jgi:hypothetical protein
MLRIVAGVSAVCAIGLIATGCGAADANSINDANYTGPEVDCCDDNVDPTKAWVAIHDHKCHPMQKRASCFGKSIAECKAMCAADKGCGGFTWPKGQLKDMDCYKHIVHTASTKTESLFLRANAEDNPATGTVYVIRHGEKQKDGCLSPIGHERANALIDMFNGKPSDWPVDFDDTLQIPKALFAHRYVTACERTNQTLTPIAEALHLVVNTEHGGDKDRSPGVGGGNEGAAEAIKQALVDGHNPVLVAWESLNMPYLIHALGTFEFPIYPQGKFDKLYIVEFTDGVVTRFESTWQKWPGSVDATWQFNV